MCQSYSEIYTEYVSFCTARDIAPPSFETWMRLREPQPVHRLDSEANKILAESLSS
jgi:hypothetical protein